MERVYAYVHETCDYRHYGLYALRIVSQQTLTPSSRIITSNEASGVADRTQDGLDGSGRSRHRLSQAPRRSLAALQEVLALWSDERRHANYGLGLAMLRGCVPAGSWGCTPSGLQTYRDPTAALSVADSTRFADSDVQWSAEVSLSAPHHRAENVLTSAAVPEKRPPPTRPRQRHRMAAALPAHQLPRDVRQRSLPPVLSAKKLHKLNADHLQSVISSTAVATSTSIGRSSASVRSSLATRAEALLQSLELSL